MTRRLVVSLIALGALLLTAVTADADDAERQYRIARRLAAEDSPEAAAALAKVVELDPQGPLADDAMLERALLLDVPRWPEELRHIDASSAARAFALLNEIAEELPGSDRADEARYLRALLRLDSVAQHDAAAARFDLLTVATTASEVEWRRAARYALAWLYEQQGEFERAGAAFQRLIVDSPGSPAATRARAGRGRVSLQDGQYGEAARWLQAAIDGGALNELAILAQRELAVRLLLARGGAAPPAGPMKSMAAGVGVKTLAGLASTPDGGLLVADRKSRSVMRFDDRGVVSGRWQLDELQAVTTDPLGRAYAAAGNGIYRLDDGKPPTTLGSQGDLAPVADLAADGLGRIWLLDGKGTQLGLLAPGTAYPRVFAGPLADKLSEIVWDGRRLVALAGKLGALIAFEPGGASRTLTQQIPAKCTALTADTAGRTALLDTKAGRVVRYWPDGSPAGSFDYRALGIERPLAIVLGPDGSIEMFDQPTDAWLRVR